VKGIHHSGELWKVITTRVNCSYMQHICISCGSVPRVSLVWRHETPPYRGCTAGEKLQWMKFFWLSFQSSGRSNVMHTGTAFCFHTPYNTRFLLIPTRTRSHLSYTYDSHVTVSLFSAVDQTLSWTKVIVMWWLSTVLVTATWQLLFIQVQKCNLVKKLQMPAQYYGWSYLLNF